MKIKCTKCGSVNQSSAKFCSACGEKIPEAITEPKTTGKKSPKLKFTAGSVIAIILSLLQILIIVLPVAAVICFDGTDFGKYDFDDIVFDFLKTMGNRATAYQRTIRDIRRPVMLAQLLLIPAGILLFVLSKKKLDPKTTGIVPYAIIASVLSRFGLFSSLYLLTLYSYNGLIRTLTIAVFLISALLCLVTDTFTALKIGGSAMFVMLIGLLLAALVTAIYVPLLGLCVVTFGDITLILGLLLLCGGSGTGSGTTVYIIFI